MMSLWITVSEYVSVDDNLKKSRTSSQWKNSALSIQVQLEYHRLSNWFNGISCRSVHTLLCIDNWCNGVMLDVGAPSSVRVKICEEIRAKSSYNPMLWVFPRRVRWGQALNCLFYRLVWIALGFKICRSSSVIMTHANDRTNIARRVQSIAAMAPELCTHISQEDVECRMMHSVTEKSI